MDIASFALFISIKKNKKTELFSVKVRIGATASFGLRKSGKQKIKRKKREKNISKKFLFHFNSKTFFPSIRQKQIQFAEDLNAPVPYYKENSFKSGALD